MSVETLVLNSRNRGRRATEKKMEKFAALREAIESLELVDAHAHNLVALDSSIPFLNCFSEASGDALSFAPQTLCFKRSLRDIAELYGSESSLSDVQQHRSCSGLKSISARCFDAARISTLLIDDGLELDKMHEIEWHKNFAKSVGRILRIERLAEKILDEGSPDGSTWTLDTFTKIFVGKLRLVAETVVALKSIAAYRSGLAINTNVTIMEAEEGLLDVMHDGSPVHITNKHFIDYVLTRSLEVALHFDLPIQIHTGFGDKDLDLRLSNPLHLRNLLEDDRFSKNRLVLLHASYPFSKEASYLASVYSQVYLDFGLAVPKLSVHGMISSVKELLELAPIKKVMFSTDGVAFPEAFYLGTKRGREVVFSVLHDACCDGDLSIAEAIEAAKDIFAENAKKFYKINVPFKSSDLVKVAANIPEQNDILIRIIWVDSSGQHRCRVVPEKHFHESAKKNGIGLTKVCMGQSSASDCPAEGTNLTAVGEIRLMPDVTTKCRIPWTKQQEMVLADMHLKPGEPWEYCPREALRRVLKVLKDEFDLEVNAGFENEFFLLKPVVRKGEEGWVPFDTSPYCTTFSFDAVSTVLHEITSGLHSLNITVEQLHSEAGKGQFEVALGYKACTAAANDLIFAREVIRSVARKHGLLATFLPKYDPEDVGSGSHVHLSLCKDGENVFMASGGSSHYGMSKIGEEFMAGVFTHLPSILAFTAPIPISYERLQPNMWSGAYLCWGKENREAPLRAICPPGVPEGVVTNFEVKAFDACANPYLGLASIIAAGIDGLRRNLILPEPIDENPDTLAVKLQRLPQSLSESVEALSKDTILREMMGEKLFSVIKAVRKKEIGFYSENKDAYKKLILQY